MTSKITRRKALAAGMATTGVLSGTTSVRDAHAWAPGPEKNVVRDLTPGSTPIRLGAYLTHSRNITMSEMLKERKNSSITEMVQQFKNLGTTLESKD